MTETMMNKMFFLGRNFVFGVTCTLQSKKTFIFLHLKPKT